MSDNTPLRVHQHAAHPPTHTGGSIRDGQAHPILLCQNTSSYIPGTPGTWHVLECGIFWSTQAQAIVGVDGGICSECVWVGGEVVRWL